jgi:hypothetical protein
MPSFQPNVVSSATPSTSPSANVSSARPSIIRPSASPSVRPSRKPAANPSNPSGGGKTCTKKNIPIFGLSFGCCVKSLVGLANNSKARGVVFFFVRFVRAGTMKRGQLKE